MLGKKIVIKINKQKLAEVFTFLENPIKEEKEFVAKIVNKINFQKDIGFAGFKDKNSLKKFLTWLVYNNSKVNIWNSVTLDECKKKISFVLRKCSKVIQKKTIKIFIFPTISEFVINKMDGVSGFSPWKNTILLGVFRTENWSKAIKDTVCHELAHALALNFNRRETIGDDLIFEGIAEHFREYFLNGQKSPWVKALSKKKARQIFLEIKPMLKTRSHDLFRALFFGTKNYPLWSGYAISYYLVKSYLDKCKEKNWIEILKTPPSKILREATI